MELSKNISKKIQPMPKKIAFVLTAYIIKYDGVSVYSENILKEFIALKNDFTIDVYVGQKALTLLKQRVGVRDNNINFITIKDDNFIVKISHLTFKLLKTKYDFVFITNMMPILFTRSKVIKVIHDLSPEINPSLYTTFFKTYHAFLIKSAKWFDFAIAYISNTTKNDLKRFYNIDQNNKKLLYVPNGIPFKVQNLQRESKEFMDKKFSEDSLRLLVVGRVNKAKGFDQVFDFCKLLDKEFKNQNLFKSITLDIAGKQTSETHKLIKDANFKNIQINFLGYVGDQQLNNYYKNSHFCFFLSKNEGYGLPLVEAMWLRSIPIISDIPIFNEIMGNSYPKFDIKSDPSTKIYSFINKIFQDKNYYNEIVLTIENIIKKEKNGYKIAAKNLLDFMI